MFQITNLCVEFQSCLLVRLDASCLFLMVCVNPSQLSRLNYVTSLTAVFKVFGTEVTTHIQESKVNKCV